MAVDRVEESREMRYSGERRPSAGPGNVARPYFCRSCGREEVGTHTPAGWYSLSKHAGMADDGRPGPMARLGVFCSADCLGRHIPYIAGVERDTGTNNANDLAGRHDGTAPNRG
jgi:hypothetical protein